MENFLFLPRVVAAAFLDVAFAAGFGLVAVRPWLPSGCESFLYKRLQRGLEICTAAMMLALIAQTYLLTATMTGSTAFATVRGQYLEVMIETRAGHALLCCVVATLALIGLLVVLRAWQTRTNTLTWILLAVLVAVAASRAATGHPAADGAFTLSVVVQLIHLISIAMWAGGIIAAGFFVLPMLLGAERIEEAVKFLRALSRAVTIALALVVLSGIYNSYRGLDGSTDPLLHTQWGGLLDLKVLLVCFALAMGASNRNMLSKSRDLSSPNLSRLAKVVRAEGVVMVLILVVSAFLANSSP